MKGKSGPVFVLQTYEDRLNNNQPNNTNELSQKLSERLTDLQNDITDGVNKLKMGKVNGVNGDVSTPPPPPLPPQETSTTPSTPTSSSPSTRSNTLKSTKPKAPPVPVKYSSLSIQSKYNPPPCPSPDYDTLSLASTTSSTKPSQESAEMESIESFKINHPANVRPKPPHTFFQKRVLSNPSNVSTIRRSRPLSVTIGEYPTLRRQPGRLDFLQNGHEGKDLTSELTQTLNRSNLKKRTESMANPD